MATPAQPAAPARHSNFGWIPSLDPDLEKIIVVREIVILRIDFDVHVRPLALPQRNVLPIKPE